MLQTETSPETAGNFNQSSEPTEFTYSVAMPNPKQHLFEVTIRVENWLAEQLDLRMPVWTPGSYLVREYARHIQDFQVIATATEKH